MVGAVAAVAAVVFIPCHVANVVATAVFVVATVVSATCGKFPFGFGRQTEVAARIVVEAVYKGLAVVPTYLFNGQIVAFEI